MRRLHLWGCAVALAVALGACKDDSASAPGTDEPVGAVIAATGEVTASRGGDGDARALERGEPVYADDVIATGDGASVRIRLEHNGALWDLGGGKSRRVDRSAAWSAPEGSGGGEAPDERGPERSAAAGRHAENQAADTRATAPREDEPEPERAPAARERAPAEPEPVEPAPAASAESEPAPAASAEPEPAPARSRSRRSGGGTGRAAGPAARVGSALAPGAAEGEESAPAPADRDGAKDTAPRQRPEPAPSALEIQDAIMDEVRARTRRCFERLAEDHDELGGKLAIAVRIRGDGGIDELSLEIEDGHLDGVPECVGGSLRRTRLDTHGSALRLQFTMTLVR